MEQSRRLFLAYSCLGERVVREVTDNVMPVSM